MIQYDPWDDNPDNNGGYVPPGWEMPPPVGSPGEPHTPTTQPDPAAPPPTGRPTGSHPWDPAWDPAKPSDPGDGRVYIWNGSAWTLTEPTSTPFGPHTPEDPGGAPSRPAYNLAPLNYPDFHAPTFSAPAPFSYDPFSYESFTAPTIEQAQNEPGFQFALNQGLKAMENSKAYLGTYRTGGTIKGLNDYARDAANQNYNDVFRRSGDTYDKNRGNAFGNWSANRQNAADAYQTNYGISRDVFDRNYQGAKDEYAPKARAAELQFGRDWDQYAYEGDDAYRKWKAQIDAAAAVANG